MSKWLVFAVVIAVSAVSAMAQENTPKAEVFGGYQYTHMSVEGSGTGLNGWNGSITGNFNKWLGVTADFSGAYKSQSASISGINASADFKAYTYTFGPVISLNHEGTLNPFVHALFGGVHASISGNVSGLGSGSVSDSGFAVMAGGGVDAKFTPHVAVRLAQVDWVHYSIFSTSGNSNVRVSTGLIFRF